MKIETLEYHDKSIDWSLDRTSFSDLTLLVGVSGVGKTMILKAIWALKGIAAGKPSAGAHWEVAFSTMSGDGYFWSGEYEPRTRLNIGAGSAVPRCQDPVEEPRLLCETLVRNGEIIGERSGFGRVTLHGKETPRLLPSRSILCLLREEEAIAPASDAFKQVIRSLSPKDAFLSDVDYRPDPEEIRRRAISLGSFWQDGWDEEVLKASNLQTIDKAAMAFWGDLRVSRQIREKFLHVFDQVEDVCFETPPAAGPCAYEYPLLKIKERGVKNWIWPNHISSGMLKTFLHISEMLLWPIGTVVLIDEFENSLGINCIDVLTEELQEDRGLQFIAASHHPYIINSISPRHWKLVTRKGNVVSTHDVTDLHINPASRQKAFLQLINLEEYREGIQPA